VRQGCRNKVFGNGFQAFDLERMYCDFDDIMTICSKKTENFNCMNLKDS